jgi:NAD(P)-dependent dehydrogenase (short-subunit alcohol dehydrogenase family)
MLRPATATRGARGISRKVQRTPETDRFAGRHVVVTGGGVGIGSAIARRLAAEGATLTLLARDVERLRLVGDELGATSAACDIRDRTQVEEAFAAAADAGGPIHALVANSGIGGPNEDGDDDRFVDLVATNLVGTYHCARAALRRLADGPETRHVVVVSSILARIAVPGYTGYSASKAGLLGLVRSLAAEVAPDNVQVNAICPGWVDTEMAWSGLDGLAAAIGGTRKDAYRQAMQEVPLRRMSRPEDVAGAVAWLLSDDARGVTGQAIDQNGGAWMG